MSTESATNDSNNDGENLSTEQLIRARTYQLFEEQICRDGHAEFDWQQAEDEILSAQSDNIDN